MKRICPPVFKSIAATILITVSVSVVTGTVILGKISSSRIISYFDQSNNSSLKLYAEIGLHYCEDRFEELLDLRLSDDPDMVETMRNDTLNNLRRLPESFSNIDIVILENGRNIVLSTASESTYDQSIYSLPKKMPANEAFVMDTGSLLYWNYFPFWRWHIIAIMSAENALLPIRFVQRTVLLIMIGILSIFSLSMLLIFEYRLRRPLRVLTQTAEAVRGGNMIKTGIGSYDEIGLAAAAFDDMVDGLNDTLSQLNDALTQKNLLLMEVHHRVRNNLNIVIGLLNLTLDRIREHDEVVPVFEDSLNRIMTMAVIHGHLYDSGDFGHLNIEDFIPYLALMIRDSFDSENRIEFEYDIDPVKFPLENAVTLGLLLNELVTNSFKFAFPDLKHGLIRISFKQSGNFFRLEVSDNGVGADIDVLHGAEKEGEVSLISELVAQLKGKLRFESDRGVRSVIEFPINANKQ